MQARIHRLDMAQALLDAQRDNNENNMSLYFPQYGQRFDCPFWSTAWAQQQMIDCNL
jgi:hypothetical protein